MIPTPPPSASANPLESAAARWAARHMLGGMSDQDRADFDQWCADDPNHHDLFVRMMENIAGAGGTEKVVRDTHRAQQRKRAGRRRNLAIGAAAVVGVWFGWPALSLYSADMRTGVGEIRQYQLADGTRLWLDSQSAVDVHIDADRRVVRLLRGRIHVDVVHEARPFEVAANEGVVRDIGTAFDVGTEGDRAWTVVTQGRVQVNVDEATTTLDKAEGVEWRGNGAMARIDGTGLERSTQWSSGLLRFDQEPLTQVIGTLNRYSRKPIWLWNDEAGARMVNGLIRVDRVAQDFPLLAEAQGLRVVDLGFVVILR
jgi:transmembrane sensor